MTRDILSNDKQWSSTKTTLKSSRPSIKMEGKIRSFPGKRRLKEYTFTKLALQDMLWKEKSDRDRNTGTKGEK